VQQPTGSALADNPAQLLLFGFLGLQTCIGTGGEFGLEFLDSTRRVNVFQLAGIKRVASVANIHANFGPGTAGNKAVSATAGHLCLLIFWMNRVFHRQSLLLALGSTGWWLAGNLNA
jgi:hypothetical protein